jgi:hypothetical protein
MEVLELLVRPVVEMVMLEEYYLFELVDVPRVVFPRIELGIVVVGCIRDGLCAKADHLELLILS